MIKIKVKNVPSQANSWAVAIWTLDGPEYSDVGLARDGYYGTFLGSGTYDLSFIGYSSAPGTYSSDPVTSHDLFGKSLVDGEAYIFDWSTKTLTLETANGDGESSDMSKFFIGMGVTALILTPILFIGKRR
jgi:hypothetical protein